MIKTFLGVGKKKNSLQKAVDDSESIGVVGTCAEEWLCDGRRGTLVGHTDSILLLKTLTDSEELQCVGHWDSDLADGSESEE